MKVVAYVHTCAGARTYTQIGIGIYIYIYIHEK